MQRSTRDGSIVVYAFALCAAIGAGHIVSADTAVEFPDDPFTPVFPAGGTTFAWQFTVNETIEITHIGLYDNDGDGFEGLHPMGLWDDEGSLVWSDTIQVGTFHPLIDKFRYIDLDPPTANGKGGRITVTPGHEYTVGFYSAGFFFTDSMLTRFGEEPLIHDVVNYPGHGVADFTPGLGLPVTALADHAFGANFMFEVVPAPSSLALLGLGFVTMRRRKR